MGRLEGADPASVRVGMEVAAAPPQHPERGYFAFVPAGAAGSEASTAGG
jgi:uncharacterized OB-fold protein